MIVNVEIRNYVRSAALFFGLIASVPMVIGFIAAFSAGLGLLLVLFGVPFALIALLLGFLVWFVRGLRRTREFTGVDRAFLYLTSPILLVATVVAAWPILAIGAHLGSLTRLLLNWSHYEAIIAKAEIEGREEWFAEHDGVVYSVDPGPPVRVAFNPDGMLDNWSGIIYDPTGLVMLADGFDPKSGEFFAPDRITKLFGGDLISCRHLWGDYYTCSFT